MQVNPLLGETVMFYQPGQGPRPARVIGYSDSYERPGVHLLVDNEPEKIAMGDTHTYFRQYVPTYYDKPETMPRGGYAVQVRPQPPEPPEPPAKAKVSVLVPVADVDTVKAMGMKATGYKAAKR